MLCYCFKSTELNTFKADTTKINNSLLSCSSSFCGLHIQRLKETLERKGFVLVPGHEYKKLLVSFGATLEDLENIESGSIHACVAKDREETMNFRQIAFHRMILERPRCSSYVSNITTADCEAVTQINPKEIRSDSGAKVYFERSGTRKWSLPPLAYKQSTVPDAMAKINDYLQPLNHHYQMNLNKDSNTTINDQLLIRINKKSLEAEPTPEGIHQDGTEISSVTLINCTNVKKKQGGESRIWKTVQPTGNYESNLFGELSKSSSLPVGPDFSWNNCLFDKALESPWETIIFNDRKVKHEARSFFKEDERFPSHRDVIVNFVRKPCSDGSDTKILNGKEFSIV